MLQPATIAALNRLLEVVGRSFPQYLQYSRPHIPPGRENEVETIASIVADQNGFADRITHMLIDAEASIRTGEFPMEFTDTHDLDIDFLVSLAIAYQEQDIATIGQVVDLLQNAPAAKALAEEALGMCKGHLESLQELTPATVK
jgi:hypothetical protein